MKNNCNPKSKCGMIIGSIFLVIATILTLLTHSDAGIFGMFVVGLGFCVCQRFAGCKTCACCGCCSCCCTCDCCTPDMQCEVPTKNTPAAASVAKAPATTRKRTTKKTV